MRSPIKSIEHLTVTLAPASATGTANLTKGQVLANSIIWPSSRVDGTSSDRSDILLDMQMLAGPDRVEGTRDTTGGTVTCEVFVVEFWPTEVSVQKGAITIANLATSGTDTITAVDQTRAFVLGSGEFQGGGFWDDAFIEMKLDSDTVVSFNRTGTAAPYAGHYQVIECLKGQWTVQALTFSFTGTSTGVTIPNAVDMSKTFIIAHGQTSATDDVPDDVAIRAELTSTTNVQLDKALAGATVSGTIFVVEFAPWTNAVVQRGEITYTADAAPTATLSPAVDLVRTIANGTVHGSMPGMGSTSGTGTGADVESCYSKFQFLNDTTLEGDHSYQVNAEIVNWEAITWPSGPRRAQRAGIVLGSDT
jgi:hypothetical protein